MSNPYNMNDLKESFLSLKSYEDDTNYLSKFRELVKSELAKEKERKNINFTRFENNQNIIQEILECFLVHNIFTVLLVTPCQFGKTNIMFWIVYNLMTTEDDSKVVTPIYSFIISGLNSNDWKIQTKSRVLPCMKDNVYHNYDITRKNNKKLLKKAIESKHNVFIGIDEVHIGCRINNTIFKRFKEFHPLNESTDLTQKDVFDYLKQQKVKLLFISATPDSIKEGMLEYWDKDDYAVVKPNIEEYPNFVSHQTYIENNRVFDTRPFDDEEDDKTFAMELVEKIAEYKKPKYHIIRLKADRKIKNSNISEYTKSLLFLKQAVYHNNADIEIITLDCSNIKSKKSIIETCIKNPSDIFQTWDDTKNSLATFTPDKLLLKKPKKHVIFILKELLRVSQTMPMNNIGILVDRHSDNPNDSTLTQSLIGRACGHNKLKYINEIQIYTNKDAILRYVSLWNNNIEYGKVPGYTGNGIMYTKKNTNMKISQNLLGDLFIKIPSCIEYDIDTDNVEYNELNEFSIDYIRLSNKEKMIYEKILEFMKTLNSKQWVSRGRVRKALLDSMPEADYRDLTAMQKKKTNIMNRVCN